MTTRQVVRLSQEERLRALHRELKAGPRCGRDLAQSLGVTQRTIKRDVADLRRRFAAPIESRPGHGYRYSEPTFELPPVLAAADVFALVMVRQAVERYRGTPLAAHCLEALDRLIAALEPDALSEAQWVLDRVVFSGRPPAPVDAKIWEVILEGLREKRTLKLTYGLAGERRQIRFDPWALIASDGDWFLYGFHHADGENRTLYLPRVASAELTPWRFEVAAWFDLRQYTADGFGGLQRDGVPASMVTLRFPPELARQAVERPWHGRQSVVVMPDGGVEVRFATTWVEGVRRAAWGWGADIEMAISE